MPIAVFERFSVSMPAEAVKACSHSGACDDDVEYWEARVTIDASADDIRAELKEYGAWDADELADDEANRRRIVWIAASNIRDTACEKLKKRGKKNGTV